MGPARFVKTLEGCPMRDDWKKCEGQVVNNKYPLQRLLGSTQHSAAFSTQYGNLQPKNAVIKFISAGAKADSQIALWRRAAELNHINLLRLQHAGRCQLAGMDLIYVVMEYAAENLGQVLPERALTADETREMLKSLLNALNYLHGKGLVHSHIKSSNVLAIGDQIKIASDTVVPLGERLSVQRPADVYDAPETATRPLAASGDIWSLGVTLVETLTQSAPISSPENQADPIVPPALPQPFFDIARQSLHRDPRLRWTTAQIADCLNRSSLWVGKGLWVDASYCWVVVCKNNWFHRRPNIFNVHRIPLGETDAVLPRPALDKRLAIRCDECGKEYNYNPADVLRSEMEVPRLFVPHALFRD
jgi:serine/threonine protein kinase